MSSPLTFKSCSSTLLGLSAFDLFAGWESDAVSGSMFLFLFVGVRPGSTEGDLSSGDAAFLNLDIDFGVLFGTCGLRLTSGVSDSLREELTDAFLRRRSEYARPEA